MQPAQKLSSRSRDTDQRIRSVGAEVERMRSSAQTPCVYYCSQGLSSKSAGAPSESEPVPVDSLAAPSDAKQTTASSDDMTCTLQALAADIGCEWREHKCVARTQMAIVVAVLAVLTEQYARLGSSLTTGQVEQVTGAIEKFSTENQSTKSPQNSENVAKGGL